MNREYLELLFEDNGAVELVRINDGITSVVFTSLDHLMAWRRRFGNTNLYTSLNRPGPHRPGQRLRDCDITVRTRLFFDFDTDGPKPASQSELTLAFHAAESMAEDLDAQGFGPALKGFSGNGAHLQYRVSVPVNDGTTAVLRRLYAGLREQVGDGVSFDTKVQNPARLCRLYNTWNCKGTASPSRPHRQTHCHIPSSWTLTPWDAVERLAARLRPAEHKRTRPTPRRFAGSGDYSTLNVSEWFAAHGALKRPLEGRFAVLCPWVAEHTTADHPADSSTVVWPSEGGNWPTFFCSHAHCEGRTILDVLALWPDADAFCTREWRR